MGNIKKSTGESRRRRKDDIDDNGEDIIDDDDVVDDGVVVADHDNATVVAQLEKWKAIMNAKRPEKFCEPIKRAGEKNKTERVMIRNTEFELVKRARDRNEAKPSAFDTRLQRLLFEAFDRHRQSRDGLPVPLPIELKNDSDKDIFNFEVIRPSLIELLMHEVEAMAMLTASIATIATITSATPVTTATATTTAMETATAVFDENCEMTCAERAPRPGPAFTATPLSEGIDTHVTKVVREEMRRLESKMDAYMATMQQAARSFLAICAANPAIASPDATSTI
ncbi:hypothetical protein CYMTET_2928 [Cymbomonas tetramitiformis]|uniref:Uncharacterized protein n=1 Tax=Cymbomonas tetramitiformis TaxID=36881 RepID=A0AAE0H497_9CHLO|nr:hypothetical protein CYMTET_2928 [Cymbomonas tetramitiformis]